MSSDCITVRVPMTFHRREGRKQVIAPNGESWAAPRTRIDSTLVKALARAFRWRRMLETGVVATVTEIAAREKINASYVSRVPRLTLLAPEIVEAVMDGRQPAGMTLSSSHYGKSVSEPAVPSQFPRFGPLSFQA